MVKYIENTIYHLNPLMEQVSSVKYIYIVAQPMKRF